MRIIGIDPGLTRCGVGVIEAGVARDVRLVHVEVIRTDPADLPPKRLLNIYTKINEIITQYQPQVAAIERVLAHENLRSVMGTAQAAGVAMLAAAGHNIPVGIHSPTEVKAAVAGDGKANKAQVQLMVKRILGLDKIVRPADAADALAIAICHTWRGATKGEIWRSQYGGKDTLPQANGSGLTPAQQLWAQAERDSRRAGAVAKGAKNNRTIVR